MPPRSTKAPKSVIFFTIPSRTIPISISSRTACLFSSRSSSNMALRESTMFCLSSLNFTILNSLSTPRNSSKSITGLISTCEPGRKACTTPKSTTIPPLILRLINPVMSSSFSKQLRISVHRFWKSALSLERIIFPRRSSKVIINTSISCPTSGSSLNSVR